MCIFHEGLGGFAVVTKCNNNLDKAPYTIKKVSILEGVEDFDFKYCIREDKFLASLDHPNIIRYYSFWVEKKMK
ncbi:hypothetical protein F8388_002028 [Cannabis sativa]|uniref:non-specific serine/threonine protein kinase n=1 Tax=Cannabis sativa TaxID=3483 RepID=A0A7J6FP01_CANSA|nr:hypothetical protein F8388_002028 [Cannabis sativa]KAF4391891.1 hypothetical protein G4B88_007466 [Cannabis sativa]